jgi:hypothetical protein
MTVELKCDGCQTVLRVPDELAGKRAKCTHCGAIFTIPSATQHFWPPGMQGSAPAAPRPAAAAKPATTKTAPATASFPAAPTTSAAPVATPDTAPLATPVSETEIVSAADAALPGMPVGDADAALAARSIRDTVSVGRGASTRDTQRAPTAAAASSGSRPIPIKRPAEAPEPRGKQGLQLGDVLSRARGIFKSNLSSLALVGFVYLAVGVVAGGAVASGLRLVRAPQVLQFFGPQAVMVWLTVGMVIVAVRAARGREVTLATLFGGMPRFPAALAIWLVCFLPIMLAGFGLGAAGLEPAIVGLVVAGAWLVSYFFLWIPALVALVDHEPRPLAAWKAGARFSAANVPVMLGLFVVSGLLLFAGLLPAGLLLPLAVPFVLLAVTVAYLRGRPARS